MDPHQAQALAEAQRWVDEAAGAAKCWPCGCLHSTLTGLEAATRDLPAEGQPLVNALAQARAKLRPAEYECLGCPTCFPALAANAFPAAFPERAAALAACPTDLPEQRAGWPPLPGEYRVIRYQAPVAICTLTDEGLTQRLAEARPAGVAIIGRLHTENLGIERIIQNTLANPNLRFLILCGADSAQRIGHLPGQSILALFQNGLDERGRIVGAKGKRPVIRNVPPDASEAFRKQVEAVDLVGCESAADILAAAAVCIARDPRPAEPFAGLSSIPRTEAHPTDRLVLDPAGYFVIFPDSRRRLLVLEHYQNDGVLDHVIEGQVPTDLYATAIELGLLTRLDHAAYLGQELARAHHALLKGHPFSQDAAPGEEPGPPPPEPRASGHTRGTQDASGPEASCGCPPPSPPR
jgi:tetrahydromethanopterin S-methyltransferase subunit A